MGCREPQHPRLGARVVIRHPYVGKSRPSVTQAEAPRWPITAPMSALSATRAGRWPRHGPRGPMGSVGSGLAPLGPARHLPGPTIGLDAPFPGSSGGRPVEENRQMITNIRTSSTKVVRPAIRRLSASWDQLAKVLRGIVSFSHYRDACTSPPTLPHTRVHRNF